MRQNRLTILRLSFGSAAFLMALTMIQLVVLGFDFEILSRSDRIIALFGLGLGLLGIGFLLTLGLLAATWTRWQGRVAGLFESVGTIFTRLGWFNMVLFAAGIGVYAYMMIGLPQRFLGGTGLRWIGYLALVLVGAWLIKAWQSQMTATQSVTAALLVSAAGYRLAMLFPELTSYPFSLGWSEGSRYFYASLNFSERLYGFQIPPSVLHPSRYLMQSVPFLIPDSPIWVHRLWQVLLWLATTLGTAFLILRRLNVGQRFRSAMFIIWISLFILLAPVYYHLLVCAILVIWGYDRQKPWRTLVIVLLASVWAGISRINWYPVPGSLAAILYFVEQPVLHHSSRMKSILKYLFFPLIWTFTGTITAFATQSLYVLWSGNPVDQFSSSFTSDLLWYRLLPNATYPLGILTGSLLVFTPMLLVILFRLRPICRLIHQLRKLGTAAILLVFFAGGLVVSVKIGGGSNLHNMDAFLILFLVVLSYAYFDRIAVSTNQEPEQYSQKTYASIYQVLLGITICIPVILTINLQAGYSLPGEKIVQDSINTIQAAIDQVKSSDGDVLFISERQLLMFDAVTGAEMVPDYEKVFLMEMAMANNPNYLNTFYDELRSHRFALIISEPLKLNRQDSSYSFGEENNAWVDRVSEPVLCYYEPIETIRWVRTELLVPRQDSGNCPSGTQ